MILEIGKKYRSHYGNIYKVVDRNDNGVLVSYPDYSGDGLAAKFIRSLEILVEEVEENSETV